MITPRIMLALAFGLLVACSHSPNSDEDDYESPAKALLARVTGGGPVVPTLASLDLTSAKALRAILAADGQPIYAVSVAKLKYESLMAPYGQNGDVQTWASTKYETLALRQGIILGTRGFGNDLMSSRAPTVSAVASGHGSFTRQYFYLDGADQTLRNDYTCEYSVNGAETIVVMGQSFATRKVSETCTGPAGDFVNAYWFDQGQVLRQSRQMIAPKLGSLILQRVID